MIWICMHSAEDMARRPWWIQLPTINTASWQQTSAWPSKAHRHNIKGTGVTALHVAVSALTMTAWQLTRKTASIIVPGSPRTIWFAMESFLWPRRTCIQTSWEQLIATSSTKRSPSTRPRANSLWESSSARSLSTITMTSTNEEKLLLLSRWYEKGIFLSSYFIHLNF